MRYLVGIDLRDSEPVALPLDNVSFVMDIGRWREGVEDRIREAEEGAQAASRAQVLPVNIFGDGDGPPDEVLDSVRNQAAAQWGSRIESLRAMLRARLVVLYHGNNYPFSDYRIVDSVEELLEQIKDTIP